MFFTFSIWIFLVFFRLQAYTRIYYENARILIIPAISSISLITAGYILSDLIQLIQKPCFKTRLTSTKCYRHVRKYFLKTAAELLILRYS